MKKPPKMPVHIGDYRRDTGHLRAAGHGAYLLLMFHYWSTGALPGDDDQLAAIACMSRAEWKRMRLTIEKFFQPGWKHNRIDRDLESARLAYEKQVQGGSRGGKAKAENKVASSQPLGTLEQPITYKEERTSSLRSDDAVASSDPRTRLFNEGLQTLAKLTGKGPDACRSFVGKCLKAADDNAIVVLGLIEDCERNRVANPAAWIAANLRGDKAHGKRTVHDAANDLQAHFNALNQPAPGGLLDREGEGAIQLLPPSRRERS